jgi:hypothetical protein
MKLINLCRVYFYNIFQNNNFLVTAIPGYNKLWLKQTITAGPIEFVLTEFDCM